jgi:hypothetical protein
MREVLPATAVNSVLAWRRASSSMRALHENIFYNEHNYQGPKEDFHGEKQIGIWNLLEPQRC